MKDFLKRSTQFPIYYIKHIPFQVNARAIRRVRLFGEFIGMIVFIAITFLVLLDNLAPLGDTVEYSSENDHENISDFKPQDRYRVEMNQGEKLIHQTHNLIYFTTKMPLHFDQATIRLTFKNPSPDQVVDVGFQDQEFWHYATQFLDVPFLDELGWSHIGSNPTLYQRTPNYKTVDEFLSHLPKDSIIGTFGQDENFNYWGEKKIPSYTPSSKDTVIDTPLRGKQIIYAYLQDEPFRMTIQKQDLNWYEDPDPMTVKVYKGDSLLFDNTVADDGIADSSHKLSAPQEITIRNPGQGFPEAGVYKVIINATDDSIIKRITTNLHKLVFQGSIYPVASSVAYPNVISSTSATVVYTNALMLSGVTDHESGRQEISVGDGQKLEINTTHEEQFIAPEGNGELTKIVIPRNDIILNTYHEYIAFDKDQFFLPTDYHVLPVTKMEDADLSDYIIANYEPPSSDGQWQVAEHTFDIRSAYIKDGRLSWIIESPNLLENKHEIVIKSIDVIFHKNSWF